MEIIYENKSLRFICHALNMGMIEFENPEEIQIISKSKPEFVVKLIDVDLTDYVFKMSSTSLLKDKIDQCETNIYDYVVFGVVLDNETQKKTLVTIPLFELILMSPTIEEQNNVQGVGTNWDINAEEWSLIILRETQAQ